LKASDCWWTEPAANVSLFDDDVHLWYSSLDLPESSLQRLETSLDEEEKERAMGICFERERTRFVVGRGLLREILGHYLLVEPSELCFDYSSTGKPSLTKEFGDRLRFNLAHSDGCAIYAVALDRRIGVDLERIVTVVEMEEIANRFFSDQEKAALHVLVGNERREAFFKIWTAKEAYLKACGAGLAHPSMNGIDAPLSQGRSSCSLIISYDIREGSQWTLEHLRPASDFMAAVVMEGSNYHLNCWQWPGF